MVAIDAGISFFKSSWIQNEPGSMGSIPMHLQPLVFGIVFSFHLMKHRFPTPLNSLPGKVT